MLKVEMWPAAHGDALWIEYGSGSKTHRILIDSGPINAYQGVSERMRALTVQRRDVELFVITHIDADHIDGAVALFQDPSLKVDFADIWFNAWPQLADESSNDVYGPEQGEFAAALMNLQSRPWNRAFAGKAVVVPAAGLLPVVELAGGARITILSPGDRQLRRLRRNWERVIAEAGWVPGDLTASLARLKQRREYQPLVYRDTFAADEMGSDNAVANGSSIAFVLDYDNLRCLFTGDAFPEVLAASLERYAATAGISGRIPFDAIKLPHHGSMKNWSSDLQQRVTSKNYLISTSGAKFKHPNPQTIDLITREETNRSVQLWFNYLSEITKQWQILRRSPKPGPAAHYPSEPEVSTVLKL